MQLLSRLRSRDAAAATVSFMRWLGEVAGIGCVLALATAGGCRPRSVAQGSSQSPVSTAVVTDAGLPAPELDLPADRLHERVDGAEPWLQSIGCNRLLAWHLADPPLELELLIFDAASGAQQALDKDSAKSRTRGIPGDEGWSNAQVVYFRRGSRYCRITAENGEHSQAIMSEARRFDRALVAGTLIPPPRPR